MAQVISLMENLACVMVQVISVMETDGAGNKRNAAGNKRNCKLSGHNDPSIKLHVRTRTMRNT